MLESSAISTLCNKLIHTLHIAIDSVSLITNGDHCIVDISIAISDYFTSITLLSTVRPTNPLLGVAPTIPLLQDGGGNSGQIRAHVPRLEVSSSSMLPERLPPFQSEPAHPTPMFCSPLTRRQCPACSETFCQPHFLPSAHDCTAPLPPSMIDRIAPQCPLCNTTVPTVPNDPNLAVERHILSGTCTGIPGGEARLKEEIRRKKDRGEMCWRKGCSKVIVVPMRCEVSKHSAVSEKISMARV